MPPRARQLRPLALSSVKCGVACQCSRPTTLTPLLWLALSLRRRAPLRPSRAQRPRTAGSCGAGAPPSSASV
eukprot:scaffold650_cov407-Prasinococcus_capsulatus_cf.AAC.40